MPCRFRYLTKVFKVGAELSFNPAAVSGEREGHLLKVIQMCLGMIWPLEMLVSVHAPQQGLMLHKKCPGSAPGNPYVA